MLHTARVADRGRDWYRGDCHVHTTASSGGELLPEQVTAAARATGLDFFAITEHNSADTHDAFGHIDDDLLVIPGQEVITETGHWLALGLRPGTVVDSRHGTKPLAALQREGALGTIAHPYAPYPGGTFAFPREPFDLFEVWNGPWASDVPWQADNEAALAAWAANLTTDIREGSWQPAIGSSDVHLAGQIAHPHTVVLADGLRAEAILSGLRAGRSWIAASAGVSLAFTASAGAGPVGIGERLCGDGRPVRTRVEVAGVPAGTVVLHTAAGCVHETALPESGATSVECRVSADGGFVRAEVRDRDGLMAALTNPIVLAP